MVDGFWGEPFATAPRCANMPSMKAAKPLLLCLALGLTTTAALAAPPAAKPPAASPAAKDPDPPGMLDEKSVAQWVAKNLKGEGWVLVNYDAEGVRLATPKGVELKSDGLVETDIRHELFNPMVDVVPLQLFAYHLAKAKGNDVDKPRNLAKTVTVE